MPASNVQQQHNASTSERSTEFDDHHLLANSTTPVWQPAAHSAAGVAAGGAAEEDGRSSSHCYVRELLRVNGYPHDPEFVSSVEFCAEDRCLSPMDTAFHVQLKNIELDFSIACGDAMCMTHCKTMTCSRQKQVDSVKNYAQTHYDRQKEELEKRARNIADEAARRLGDGAAGGVAGVMHDRIVQLTEAVHRAQNNLDWVMLPSAKPNKHESLLGPKHHW